MNEAVEQHRGASAAPIFVILTPSWNENMGGSIALHTLCARLNQLGYRAYLWPATKPLLSVKTILRFIRHYPTYVIHGKRSFSFGPFANTLASGKDIGEAVIVYPEIVPGNPLNAARVVRWCLHKPGYHSGKVRYSAKDRLFFYLPDFYDNSLSPEDKNLLKVTYINEAYRKTNDGIRTGSCFLVRKGKNRKHDRHPQDAIQVDDMSHAARAAIFNKVEFLYTYDRYTFYTIFAAMCGCIPIYLPADDEEAPDVHERSNGQAYGIDDIERAKRTLPALLDWVASFQAEETELIERFVQKCAHDRWPVTG